MRSMDSSDKNEISGCAQKNRRVRRHPLIPSKTVVDEEPSKSAFLHSFLHDNKKATSVTCLAEAKLICRHKLLQTVPNKMSSTGVRVFYLCDDPSYKKVVQETNKTGNLLLELARIIQAYKGLTIFLLVPYRIG